MGEEHVHSNSDPVRHSEDKVPQTADEKRDEVCQQAPGHDDAIFSRGTCMELCADLGDEKRGQKHANAHFGDCLCVLWREKLEFRC